MKRDIFTILTAIFCVLFVHVTMYAQEEEEDGGGAQASEIRVFEMQSLDVERGIHTPSLVNLKTHNGMFITAENGGNGTIVANREKAREWETFTIVDLNQGLLMSGDQVHLKTYSRNSYVSASGNGLNASKSKPAQAETFTILKLRGSGPIVFGDKIALMTSQNRYVVAEGGGGEKVNADRTTASVWETFTIVKSKYLQASVLGTWKDIHGNQYNFGQKGNEFWWRAPELKLYGQGTIDGDAIQNEIYAETNHQLKGKVSGELKVIRLDGVAGRIEWSDGMVFTR